MARKAARPIGPKYTYRTLKVPKLKIKLPKLSRFNISRIKV